MDKQSLKQKGLTPTHCAVLYLRYCLQHLPYNSDALAEVADVAPLNNAQYKAVQKALQSRLTNPACVTPGLLRRSCDARDKRLTSRSLGISPPPQCPSPDGWRTNRQLSIIGRIGLDAGHVNGGDCR